MESTTLQKSLCNEYGITKIVIPPNKRNEYNADCEEILMCPNMTILIIPSMAMATVVTNHDMCQFNYYNSLKKNTKLPNRVENKGAEIIILDDNFNTNEWNKDSLSCLPDWIGNLPAYTIKQIKEKNEADSDEDWYYDLEFLKAMTWVGLEKCGNKKTKTGTTFKLAV